MEARRLGLAAGDGTHAIGDLGYSGARNFALVTQNRVKRRL
jgi:hypothetical protein